MCQKKRCSVHDTHDKLMKDGYESLDFEKGDENAGSKTTYAKASFEEVYWSLDLFYCYFGH